ncbi:uncharacterized protein [Miscanthus floridulus]|uniref:uncharacterized protein isoform X2 n=1 Tax=Miscanthus floridulus TaxID=154761 RepID=UPI00345B3000
MPVCRVDAYALNKDSIPKSGEVGLQYPGPHGVTNVVFPVTMSAYNHSEAPEFVENEVHANPANFGSAASDASFDTAAKLGYDREVLQEAYAWQHRANARLQRAGYLGYGSDSGSSSYSVSS